MYVKFPPEDLNPDPYPPHSKSTYTYGVTIALRKCGGASLKLGMGIHILMRLAFSSSSILWKLFFSKKFNYKMPRVLKNTYFTF